MIKIILAMYIPDTDCAELKLSKQIHVSFDCQKCNYSFRLGAASNIAYLTRLAQKVPGLYAKLAYKKGGLQKPVEVRGDFN